MIIIRRCKREEYIKAWEYMVDLDINNEYKTRPDIYRNINPYLNKEPLSSEIDNFCTIAYDNSIDCSDYSNGNFEYGLPVGIFSFVVTKRKIIGKQLLVNKNYFNQGIGKALLLENEKTLLDNGYDKYYICASKPLNNIYIKYWKGVKPFFINDESDIYKFNIDLKRDNLECFNILYMTYIVNNKNIFILNNSVEEVAATLNNTEHKVYNSDNNDNYSDSGENSSSNSNSSISKKFNDLRKCDKNIDERIIENKENKENKGEKEFNQKRKRDILKNLFTFKKKEERHNKNKKKRK